MAGGRQRFTLAHELGHLLLHGRLTDGLDEERACHRFASAFLLPAESLRCQLGNTRHNLEPRELYLLKHEFGLSMQSCLYRATDLDIISEKLRDRMFMIFSKTDGAKRSQATPTLMRRRSCLSSLFTGRSERALLANQRRQN